jgi:hypothetical protein
LSPVEVISRPRAHRSSIEVKNSRSVMETFIPLTEELRTLRSSAWV